MKQLIIGMYDSAYDYTICELLIENNETIKIKEFSRYGVDYIDKSDYHEINEYLEISELGKIIYYDTDTLKQYLLNNYYEKYDSILIVDDGWVEIVK